MKRYAQYFTAMVEKEDGDYYKVEDVEAKFDLVKERILTGLQSADDIIALYDIVEAKMRVYKKALEWMVNNPGAHPANVVAVAKEALK